jgi:sec-independent protein translocase protein TatC
MTQAAPPEPPRESPEEPSNERYLTLLEHLQELRYRVVVCSLSIVVGLAVSAYFTGDFIDFLKKPAEKKVENFQLVFLDPFENFATYFKVALLGSLILAMPVILYQVLRFVSPGLKPGERRWLYGTVAGATLLFLSGVAFAYYLALPPALDFLLNFQSDLARPSIRVGAYIDFVTRLLFWTGVAFETPIVIMFLARFRVVNARQLIGWWRVAIVVAFVIAAIVTPSIDPITQTVVAGPIIALYFVGIILALFVQPRRPPEE